MPSAREMLHIVAQDPVAQARFFILSMRLFCEHVLGTGPFDEFLRHNGWRDGAKFSDGFAASGLGGAFSMVAAMHGPIEEQARLSIHPHILLWFVHNQNAEALDKPTCSMSKSNSNAKPHPKPDPKLGHRFP